VVKKNVGKPNRSGFRVGSKVGVGWGLPVVAPKKRCSFCSDGIESTKVREGRRLVPICRDCFQGLFGSG